MSALEEVSGVTAFAETLSAHEAVLADFYTPSCIICKKLEPMLAVVAEEFSGKLAVRKINAEAVPQLAVDCEVRGVPSLVLLKRGKLVDRKVGYVSAGGLREWLGGHVSRAGE